MDKQEQERTIVYAVVGIFGMDPTKAEEQRRGLDEYVIPHTREAPGFVAGYWTMDREASKSYGLTVFESEEQARDFVRVIEGDRPVQDDAGVGPELLTVAEVVGEARR